MDDPLIDAIDAAQGRLVAGLSLEVEMLKDAVRRIDKQLQIAKDVLTHIAQYDCAESQRVADDALTRMLLVE